MDTSELKDLATSIQTNGLFHPIVVRKPFDTEVGLLGPRQVFVLSMGGRRLAAHLLLGRTHIEANLKTELDPINAEICELDENIKRAQLTWDEETNARARIAELIKIQNPTANIREISEEMGISHAQLSKDVSLAKQLKENPKLKQATSKGAAIRSVQFSAAINERLAQVKTTDIGDLTSRLHCADAREFIKDVQSQSIDLVFGDLPYGTDYFATRKDANETTKGYYDDDAEKVKRFIADIVPECLRVVKPTGWVVFFMCYEWHGWLQDLIHHTCKIHFKSEIRGSLQESMTGVTRYMGTCIDGLRTEDCTFPSPEMPPWIWTRRGKGNHGHWPELHASNRYEMLVVVNGGSAKLTKKPVENVLDFPPFEGERLHEMQKPHALCREIIERTTVIGEKVLDICFGSGAHLAAAASLGRDFFGCDNNPDNLKSATALVSQHYNKAAMDALLKGRVSSGV